MKTKRLLVLILLIIPFVLTALAKKNIEIRTNVGFATIHLNGRPPIRTDKNGIAEIQGVAYGTHKIQIEKDDYISFNGTITINQDPPIFPLYLEKKIILQISCNAAGADIFINDKKKGVTDSNGKKTIKSLPRERTYKLEIKHKCFEDFEKYIKLGKGLNKQSNLSLVKIEKWKLPIYYNARDVDVFIDDKKQDGVETVKGMILELSPGEHTIRIEKEGYNTVSKKVTIKKCSSQDAVLFEMTALRAVHNRNLLLILIGLVLVAASIISITYLKASKKIRTIGKFELIKRIEHSGNTAVYKAKDQKEKKIIALKILDPTLGNDAEIVRKFFNEWHILHTLNEKSPNAPVVKVFDHGDMEKKPGIPYIAMQWLKGDTLRKMMKRKKELPLVYKLYIVGETVKGLCAAHELKIFHGRLTPDNIIVKDKHVTLIAFGIETERCNSNANAESSQMEKFLYMSPEQCAGIPIDEKSNIYSLGIILFELFNGVPPFTAENTVEIMKMHRESPLPALDPLIPEDINELMLRLLEKQPDNRPSITELGETLERLILKYTIGSIK